MPARDAPARSFTCTCCGERGVRRLVRLPDLRGVPVVVAVCPTCDTRGVRATAAEAFRQTGQREA